VYPNIHYLNRQAMREKLAAKQALTEAARQRHLALAEHYLQRAEAARAALEA
jgi:t-SNARE complex subunit (syntaxin)